MERVTFELDEDTALEKVGEGLYRGDVSDRWMVGGGPNGGYLAAFCLQAVLAESPMPDPLTMTVHYLSRPLSEIAEVSVSALRLGRGHATFGVELSQSGERRCVGLVTCGKLRDLGPLDFQPVAPDVPPPATSVAISRIGEHSSLRDRIEIRAARSEDLFFLRTTAGQAATGGWTRLADGRPTDALSVALFLDCWPPAVFGRTMRADILG
ncbi:MAG: thioesterase family protein, partial [Acidimicrobiales bacterium]